MDAKKVIDALNDAKDAILNADSTTAREKVRQVLAELGETETVQCEHTWSNGRRCQLAAVKVKSAEGKSHCPIHYNFPKQTSAV